MKKEVWGETNDTRELLRAIPSRQATPRKLRILMVAWSRALMRAINDSRLAGAIDFAEDFADELHTKKELMKLWKTFRGGWSPVPVSCLLETDSQSLREAAEQFALESGGWQTLPAPIEGSRGGYAVHIAKVEDRNHCLRCIFGNPFRPVAFAPTWRTEAAVALATGIYEDRAFDRLPILADALEEAGCYVADVLTHCRGTGPHARGCWVVDGVLGKL